MGYYRAGFEVFGIDICHQPNYPFSFVQMDALEVGRWIRKYDVVHASPPCQAWSQATLKKNRLGHRDLIGPIREVLQRYAAIYVIENVPGAPLVDPVVYCGSSFEGLEIRRHRLFESNVHLVSPPCNHSRFTERKFKGSSGCNLRFTCSLGRWDIPLAVKRQASDIHWMNEKEISQAIPPAYTEHIGDQLMRIIQ